MCTYIIAKNSNANWPLIIAGNRDESLSRRSQVLHEWPGSTLFAGKDLEKGGTWLGMRRDGRFGLVSNFRSVAHPINHADNNISRGVLLRDLLLSENSLSDYFPTMQQQAAHCQGFNLFYGEILPKLTVYYYSNATNKLQEMDDGIYAFANNLFTDPPWEKALRLHSFTKHLLEKMNLTADNIVSEFLQKLQDEKPCADALVPQDTGLSFEVEKLLSAIYIKPTADNFGTRVSTVMLVNKDKRVTIVEGVRRKFDELARQSFTLRR